MSPLSNDLSDIARNVHKVTDFIKQCQTTTMTAADCAALRALVSELEAFVRTGSGADS